MGIIFGGLGALAIVGGLIFASANGLLGAKKPNAGGAAVLSAPPAQTVRLRLTAPAPDVATAPVVNAPPAQTKPMPAEVIEYLRWLKKFEAGRVAWSPRAKRR
jgi:hypothetical protein